MVIVECKAWVQLASAGSPKLAIASFLVVCLLLLLPWMFGAPLHCLPPSIFLHPSDMPRPDHAAGLRHAKGSCAVLSSAASYPRLWLRLCLHHLIRHPLINIRRMPDPLATVKLADCQPRPPTSSEDFGTSFIQE
eukprot:TRINITY_DN44939_c0_g1_i2.p1 TRINITY_DN44939_c0_g1~~TRINITY_DN44939_c0_g1_i2.p1  ORF type:complete len:135 (-),score=1.02 TRINITY_DN44939_c0_g1_i2:103-507(-)